MYFSFIFWGNFFCSLFFTAPKIAFAISNYSSSTKKYSGMDILVSSILIYIDLEEDRGDRAILNILFLMWLTKTKLS